MYIWSDKMKEINEHGIQTSEQCTDLVWILVVEFACNFNSLQTKWRTRKIKKMIRLFHIQGHLLLERGSSRAALKNASTSSLLTISKNWNCRDSFRLHERVLVLGFLGAGGHDTTAGILFSSEQGVLHRVWSSVGDWFFRLGNLKRSADIFLNKEMEVIALRRRGMKGGKRMEVLGILL